MYLIYFVICAIYLKEANADLISIQSSPSAPTGKDITNKVFPLGKNFDVFPAAYGDFNGDKLTDIVILDKGRTTVTIYLASKVAPYFRPGPQWNFTKFSQKEEHFGKINSVVMGDFTGNGLIDLMLTSIYVENNPRNQSVSCKYSEAGNITNYQNMTINYQITHTKVIFCIGDRQSLNCSQSTKSGPSQANLKNLVQEPMAIDLNRDMILDLVGEFWQENKDSETVYHFNYKNQSCNCTGMSFFKIKAIWLSEEGKPAEKFEDKVFVFNETKSVSNSSHHWPLSNPSSNAFVDVDSDQIPDLVLITKNNDTKKFSDCKREVYDVSFNSEPPILTFTFKNYTNVSDSHEEPYAILGQPLFIDLERNGKLIHLIPFCSAKDCKSNWGLFASNKDQRKFHQLLLGPITHEGSSWKFVPPIHTEEIIITSSNGTKADEEYEQVYNDSQDTINGIENLYHRSLIIQSGDYNLDGYPDLIVVLESKDLLKRRKAVVFENVPCAQSDNPCPFTRTFQPNFKFLEKYENVTAVSFFDLKENGMLDVILVQETTVIKYTTENGTHEEQHYEVRAFETSSNVDSYFIKVMVLSGKPCPICEDPDVSYGNLITGAQIQYQMQDVFGNPQTSVSSQNYRSGYTTLDTPYTIFGIGHSPNFVDHLEVFLGYRYGPNSTQIFKHNSHQIIPNSHIVFIPSYPIHEYMKSLSWKVQLFLTPGDAVLQTFGVLIAIIAVVGAFSAGLEYKERREDKKERMAEARRFLM